GRPSAASGSGGSRAGTAAPRRRAPSRTRHARGGRPRRRRGRRARPDRRRPAPPRRAPGASSHATRAGRATAACAQSTRREPLAHAATLPPVRGVAVVTVALALAATAHAAPRLTVAPAFFSPDVAGYVTAAADLPRPANVAVRVATREGVPLAVIDPPAPRSAVGVTWDGRVRGRHVPDGDYQLQIVERGTVVASATVHVDTAPARLLGLRVTDGDAPYAGDTPLLATVSPNGDGYRDTAHVHFTLVEPARVTLAVQRANTSLETLSARVYTLGAGP